MPNFGLLLVCVQACFVQNAFCWKADPWAAGPLGYGAGLAGSYGLANGLGHFGAGPLTGPLAPGLGAPLAPGLGAPLVPGLGAPLAPGLGVPYAPAALEGSLGAYGGKGIGDVAIAGEMPVAGTTLIAGQVPILGAVRFAGDIPAGGVVSIAGSCGYGRLPYY